MESNRKLRKSFIKAKLAMSFYRAAKPSCPMPYTSKPNKPNNPMISSSTNSHQPKQNIASTTPSSVGFIVNQDQLVTPHDQPKQKQKVSFVLPDSGRDSYWTTTFDHSPYDDHIDVKAASYISCVQERFKLERLNSERNMSSQDMH